MEKTAIFQKLLPQFSGILIFEIRVILEFSFFKTPYHLAQSLSKSLFWEKEKVKLRERKPASCVDPNKTFPVSLSV